MMSSKEFLILIAFAIPLLSVGWTTKSVRRHQMPSSSGNPYSKLRSPPFSRALFKDVLCKATNLAATKQSVNFNTSEDLLFDANIPEYARRELWLRDKKLSELNLQMSEKKTEVQELKVQLSEEQKRTAEYFNSLQNAIRANCFANLRSIIGEIL